MQAADLIKYIEEPGQMDAQSVAQLRRLTTDFPYFQPAHLLLSMSARRWDAAVYQQSLKKTAIAVPNRSQLFHLIQRIERDMEKAVTPLHEKEKDAAPQKTVALTTAEETRQELDNLKAVEIVADLMPEKDLQQSTIQAPEKSAEEKLEEEIGKSVVASFVEKEILKTPGLHKPRPRQEPESFVEWLALMKKNNGQPNQPLHEEKPRLRPRVEEARQEEKATPQADTQSRKERQKALIDKIIDTNPGIIRGKEDQKFFNAELRARESLLESEHLVTETLARIYALQGSVNKAVRAYEILSLKYPQKSAYFATLIQKLKTNP